MMRRHVVLPQPDGSASTMNSPSGTVSEMPLTAGTSPNFLTISLANTADIEPPRIQCVVCRAAQRAARSLLFAPSADSAHVGGAGPRIKARPGQHPQGLAAPLFFMVFHFCRAALTAGS